MTEAYENLTKEYLGVKIDPCGFKMIAMPLIVPQKTNSGLIIVDSQRDRISEDSMVAKILAMGVEAGKDEKTFPYGPHCKIGDWVHISINDKQPKRINNKLCFYISDNKCNSILDRNDLIKIASLESYFNSIDELEKFMKLDQSKEDYLQAINAYQSRLSI